jgi:hypothetical protein
VSVSVPHTRCAAQISTRREGAKAGCSHYSVCRPPSALRYGPPDVLLRHLDAAALAVHAVLRIDD